MVAVSSVVDEDGDVVSWSLSGSLLTVEALGVVTITYSHGYTTIPAHCPTCACPSVHIQLARRHVCLQDMSGEGRREMTDRAKQLDAQLQIIRIVAEAIRDLTLSNANGLGGVPSGHLYAQLMGTFTLAQYQSVVNVLKRAKLVDEKNHLLVWIGGAL